MTHPPSVAAKINQTQCSTDFAPCYSYRVHANAKIMNVIRFLSKTNLWAWVTPLLAIFFDFSQKFISKREKKKNQESN